MTKLFALSAISPAEQMAQLQTKKVDNQQNFKEIFKNALENVSAVEQEADLKTNAFIRGEMNDLHEVMIASQKAKLTVEASVQIQQKVIDTYNDVMRMQI